MIRQIGRFLGYVLEEGTVSPSKIAVWLWASLALCPQPPLLETEVLEKHSYISPRLKCVTPSWKSELEGGSFVTSRALAGAKLRKCYLHLWSEVPICCCYCKLSVQEQSSTCRRTERQSRCTKSCSPWGQGVPECSFPWLEQAQDPKLSPSKGNRSLHAEKNIASYFPQLAAPSPYFSVVQTK